MSQIKLCPIRSSSKGNSTIVFTKETKILVDCGLSGKVVEDFFKTAGLDGNSLDAIVVTHEHSDHTKGVGIISRKYNIPIFANAPTWQAMNRDLGKIAEQNKRIFSTGKEFYINDVKVQTFFTSHDAAESVGYVFEKNSERVAVATDMGFVSPEIIQATAGCHTVLLEANYDANMLDIGSYPYVLKRRIKGERGHLDNCDAAEFAHVLAENGTKCLFLGHLSEENNYPPIAYNAVKEQLCGECDLLVVEKDGKISKY